MFVLFSRMSGFLVQPFPCMQWLQLISVPPSTIEDFVMLRSHLIRFEVRDAGLDELARLFGHPSADTSRRLRSFRDTYLHEAVDRSNMQAYCHDASSGGGHRRQTGIVGPVTFVLPLDNFTEMKGTKLVNLLWSKLLFLRIHNCGLTHFDHSLSLLPFISHLDVSGNYLSKLKHLCGCLNLRVANLSTNLFSSVANIGIELSNVQSLNLSRNKIKSLKGMESLHFLEKVDVSYNQISRVSEVEHLVHLRFLQDLSLVGNPVATLFAFSGSNDTILHRHPMWETFVRQQHRVWQELGQRSSNMHRQEDARLQWADRGLYRIMVFAYFYPEISPTGHYRSREMVTLDGEDISEIESEIIK